MTCATACSIASIMHCSVDVDDVVGNDEPDSGSGLLAAREAWRRLTTLMRLSDPVRLSGVARAWVTDVPAMLDASLEPRTNRATGL